MLKRAWFFSVCLAFFYSGHAQEFEEEFTNNKTLSELMHRIRLSKDDSDKVRSLLSLCEYHMFYSHNIDSAIGYAQKARMLSMKIKYQSGADDAIFYLCKLYAHEKGARAATPLLDQVQPDQRVRLLLT